MNATGQGAAEGTAFSPFRYRAFRWLWIGVLVSSTGTWAQTVGAQWLFVNDANAATIVPLVQTASTLPVMLFALPAGVLSDAFDRRWLLFSVQVYAVVVSVLLAVLTALGLMPPSLLLMFTFAVGAGMALALPTWQPMITELVPRSELAAATRLDMVNVNIARAAGPALAGTVIAHWGVPPVFAFNAACVAVLALILLAWRRPLKLGASRERFLPALRAGGRYVRHDPIARLIMGRLALFIAPATALWALLPLIADRELGLDASGYGLLFAALGVGAVTGALTLGKVKERVSWNDILAGSAAVYAVAFALLMVVPWWWLGLPLLVAAGYGWTATISTLVAELQLVLPGWVRARGLAISLMTFTGTQALVSPLWGLLTALTEVRVAVWTAAALVAAGIVAGLFLRLPEGEADERVPLVFWTDATLLVDAEPDIGPVVVSVEYDVPAENEAAFFEAMQDLRRSRRRSGATRWELYRVGEEPQRFVEQFAVATWEEHLHQHERRLTTIDKAIEDRAFAFAVGTPTARHLLPPVT